MTTTEPTDRPARRTQPGYSGDVPAASMPAPVTGVPSAFPRPEAGRRDERVRISPRALIGGSQQKIDAAAAGVEPTGEADEPTGAASEPASDLERAADAESPVAPSVAPDSDPLRDEIEDCSATCVQRICEWCPGQDRFEAVAQWLYKAVIARQDRIPTDDVTPWSSLSKDQRNGWRGWATELLEITDGPLQQLRREHAERGEALERVRRLHVPLDRGTGPQCQGCATHVTFTPWPCPTIRALDGSGEGQ